MCVVSGNKRWKKRLSKMPRGKDGVNRNYELNYSSLRKKDIKRSALQPKSSIKQAIKEKQDLKNLNRDYGNYTLTVLQKNE